ncbi:MAG: hypothetical protein QXP36_13660 [Conexivisphaerales archaeon]
MGKMEFEMKHARFPLATRYAPYVSLPPEDGIKHIDEIATMQLVVKEIERLASRAPEKIRVTIEWDDIPEEVGKQ